MTIIVLTTDPGDMHDGVYLDEPPCPICCKGRLIREPTSEYDVAKLTCTAFTEEMAGENCASVFQLEPKR